MKASDFITHLQQMIEEHGDLPLALMEYDQDLLKCVFVECDGVDWVKELSEKDLFLDSSDNPVKQDKIFLID